METYKQLVAKWAKKWAPRFDGLKKQYKAECNRSASFVQCVHSAVGKHQDVLSVPIRSSMGAHQWLMSIRPGDRHSACSHREREEGFKLDHIFGLADDQGHPGYLLIGAGVKAGTVPVPLSVPSPSLSWVLSSHGGIVC